MSEAFEYWLRRFNGFVPGPPAYSWDEWNYTDMFYVPVANDLDFLKGVSPYAARGLTIALGEWLCFQTERSARTGVALSYFDAAWVSMIVREDGLEHIVLDHGDWPGPACGVLRAAMLIVNDAVFEAGADGRYALRACWALNLARRTINPTLQEGFEAWLGLSLERLATDHSDDGTLKYKKLFDEHFDLGEPVAPSLFVADRPYHQQHARREIAGFINGMIGSNDFLLLKEPLEAWGGNAGAR